MSVQPQTSVEAALAAILAFWEEAGVDCGSGPVAGEAAPDSAPAKSRPITAPPSILRASPPQAAAAIAAQAHSLRELEAAIAGFEAGPVKAAAKRVVFADGVEGAPVMLIGEAPGKEEEDQGRPFVGRSGQLLDRMLAAIGLSRDTNLYLTNCVFWRQPGNSNPGQQNLAACLPFVERAIALARPRLLLLVGGVAGQTILRRSEGVMRLRGRRLLYGEGESTQSLSAMVILHPAYLLRRPQEKALAWADLLALETWLEELGIEPGPRL